MELYGIISLPSNYLLPIFLLELARIQCTINSNSMGDVSFVKEIQFGDYQYVFMSVAFIMIFTT